MKQPHFLEPIELLFKNRLYERMFDKLDLWDKYQFPYEYWDYIIL